MRICVCDDEPKDVESLMSLITKIDPSFELFPFQSAESMFEGMKTQQFDIVFLDIEMGGMNGFEAAKKLNDTPNPPLIIFFTNSNEYTHLGYEVAAFRYMPKPIDFDKLSEYLSAAVESIIPRRISIVAAGKTHTLSIYDIVYIEASSHNLIIYTTTQQHISRMTLTDIEAQLPKTIFTVSHKGYLVNLAFIDIVEEKELVLTDKRKIPLSRRRKSKVEQELIAFIGRA